MNGASSQTSHQKMHTIWTCMSVKFVVNCGKVNNVGLKKTYFHYCSLKTRMLLFQYLTV